MKKEISFLALEAKAQSTLKGEKITSIRIDINRVYISMESGSNLEIEIQEPLNNSCERELIVELQVWDIQEDRRSEYFAS